jgi:hypothetical protein
MNRIAKFVAPLALFAAFGAAQAGEVVYGDINLKPVMAGSAATASTTIVGAPSGETAFGLPARIVYEDSVPAGETQFAGKRIVQPMVIGA